MPAKVVARLDRLSELDVLRVFFSIDSRNKREYRGFVQIPDLYLAAVGLTSFESPGDWQTYLDGKEVLLRKALALPCLRHVKDPPMIPDEVEFLDLKAIHGTGACPVCGARETGLSEGKMAKCIACGREEAVMLGCGRGHHVCKGCLELHLDKHACPTYKAGKGCPGRDCNLLR